MAEPTSWTKPGNVSCAERVPPPTMASASSTSTERPFRANSTAAARPLGPEPTTTASYILLPFLPLMPQFYLAPSLALVLDPERIAVGFSDGASYTLSVGNTNGYLVGHTLAFSPRFIAPAATGRLPAHFRLPRSE